MEEYISRQGAVLSYMPRISEVRNLLSQEDFDDYVFILSLGTHSPLAMRHVERLEELMEAIEVHLPDFY